MDRHDDLAVALTPLIDALERLGVAWYVGGSVASTVHGRFRATNDVDVVADLREEHASQIGTSIARFSLSRLGVGRVGPGTRKVQCRTEQRSGFVTS